MRSARAWTMLLPLGLALGAGSPAAAQQQLTVERIFASGDLRPRGVALSWLADGESFAATSVSAGSRATDLWVEGIRTGQRTRLVEGVTLMAADSARPVEIEKYAIKNGAYLNLGKWQSNDQIEAARQLGSLPYVEPARIGIWEWSYGGFLTGFTLQRGGEVFRAGASVAPVTDWHLYDTIYTERLMRTPQANPEGYRESSALVHKPQLRSRFLLIHGTADYNVHFQNSVKLADQLIEAKRQFDFMLYPNQTHSISSGHAPVHVFTLLTDWFTRNL